MLSLFFNQMDWITANEPVTAFDMNGNGRIDFNDIVRLFEEIDNFGTTTRALLRKLRGIWHPFAFHVHPPPATSLIP